MIPISNLGQGDLGGGLTALRKSLCQPREADGSHFSLPHSCIGGTLVSQGWARTNTSYSLS